MGTRFILWAAFTFCSHFDFHRHVAELLIDALAPQKWPPVIKVSLHGPPHRDPSNDSEAFTRDEGPGPGLISQHYFAKHQARGEEYQPNDEAHPALSQH